ncbi:unnamed protein product [Closterium sp. NIES-54]
MQTVGLHQHEPPEQLSRPTALQPSRPAAEPPSSRAAQQPSRPAAEPPSRPATEQPSRPAAAPPCSRAAEPPYLRASTVVMATPSVLAFDTEGRAIDFDVWIDDLQLFLQCDRVDGLSLFDLTSGASPAPAADANATVRSQWATRNAAAHLAVRRHLPTSERAYFSQYKSAQTLYDAVVGRYSSPATAALSRLLLPYLFPDLAAFSTVADLITHLRTSDTRYRAALSRSEPGVGATVAAVGEVEAAAEVVEVAVEVVEVAAGVVLVETQPPSVEAQVVASANSSRVPARPRLPSSFVSGTLGVGGLGVLFRDAVELPRWHDLLMQNVPIFDLDFDDFLAAMYALTDSAEGDCYLSVPPDPGIAAVALDASASAALGTGESGAPGAGESALSGIAPTEVLHTFTLDSGASRTFFRDSTTLTPLSRPLSVSLADPSGGPVLAHSSTVLPCPAAPSGLLSGLHLPSFSTNLVSGADLQDAWVDQFAPGGQRVTHYTCSQTGRHLATFTHRLGSSLYTLTTAPPPVSAFSQVAASSQVIAAASRSSPASAPCSCRPLSHENLLGHHRLGHPSLPRLRGMASPRVRGQGHKRYFLLVVDDYSRYITVFPLRSKGEVPEVLIDWIRGARRQLSESFGSDLPVLRLHSDRGGEFSSDLLRAF